MSYSSVSHVLSDKTQFPFFYTTVPKEGVQYLGILKLLQHFQWTSVGLFAPDSGNGEHFIRTLVPVLFKKGICVVFSEILSGMSTDYVTIDVQSVKKWKEVNVFIYFAEVGFFLDGFMVMETLIRISMLQINSYAV